MNLRASLPVIIAAALLPFGAGAADESKSEAAAKAAAAKAAKDERQCSMPSSPRLQKKGDDCEHATDRTRSYSGNDIKDTGQSSTAEALRRLDPRVN